MLLVETGKVPGWIEGKTGAFSLMMTDRLPVTLPINATEDRVIGGWQLDRLLVGEKKWQPGLLQQADRGFLYIDEVNLLDDHIVNLILDASSTGFLVIQREGEDRTVPVSFGLIGTMNPKEGELRPQLLDRFGLCVYVQAEVRENKRRQILEAILDFDQQPNDVVARERQELERKRNIINAARNSLMKSKAEGNSTLFSQEMAELCVRIAQHCQAEGHRGDHVLALASRALAALKGEEKVTYEHIQSIAQMALRHRMIDEETHERLEWSRGILEGDLDGR